MTPDLVLAAVGQLRVSWGWLRTALEPSKARRNERVITDAGRARQNQRAAEERAHRGDLLDRGKPISSNQHSPANVTVLDARITVSEEVDALGWSLADKLRRSGRPVYRPSGATADTLVKSGLDYISANAQHVTDARWLNTAHQRLTHCDQLAARAVGADHQRRPMSSPCPVCDERLLAWSEPTEQQREAFVACGNQKCQCTGPECPCALPDRTAGTRHLWVEARWNQLAEQINPKETA